MSYYRDLRSISRRLTVTASFSASSGKYGGRRNSIPWVRWQFRGLAEEQRRAFLRQCDEHHWMPIRYAGSGWRMCLLDSDLRAWDGVKRGGDFKPLANGPAGTNRALSRAFRSGARNRDHAKY